MFRSILSVVHYLKSHKIILAMTILAWILTLMPFLFDGQYGCTKDGCGMIIGSNYRDAVWFIAVAESAFQTSPFRLPIYAGAPLQGYHYVPNLVAYALSFCGIPVVVSYYKLIPILYMTGMTFLSVILARKIKDTPLFVGILLFFIYFGMHLSLVTSLYHTGTIQNTVLINTFQQTRILESPHTAIAYLFLMTVLIILYKRTKFHWSHVATIALSIFLALGIKVYVAVLIIMIVCLHEFFILFKTRTFRISFLRLSIYASAATLALVLFYDILDKDTSGSLFIFSPFATVHHLIENKTMFYMERMVLARYFLYEHGWSPRLYAIELFSTFLYILFYFGTRIIGFAYVLKQIITRKITIFELSLIIPVILLTGFSVLFIQKGDWYNPMQFAVPASFLMSYLSAKLLYELIVWKKVLGYAILTAIVLITLPANFVNATYFQNPARMTISRDEMEALSFLKSQPDGVVYHPIDENDMPYVSAFSGKQTYVNVKNVLENNGIDFADRMENMVWHKVEPNQLMTDYAYISRRNIDYDFLLKKFSQSSRWKIYYRNSEVVIFIPATN